MHHEENPILKAVEELKEMFRSEPSFVDQNLIKHGDTVLAIYSDPNFSLGFQDVRAQRDRLLFEAINDISSGANLLKHMQMGLVFSFGKISAYSSPFGSRPSGTIVFSLSLKDSAAFEAWRKEEASVLSQEDMNAAIYRLIHVLALDH